jgi:phosphoribosylaminoimidazole carboxylase
VPVATVAINNSTNAALLAIRILGSHIPAYLKLMDDYMTGMETEVLGKDAKLGNIGWAAYLDGMGKK